MTTTPSSLRQKEQARQQKQRDKAERKSLRKLERQEGGVDEMSEMLEHAKAQAALFDLGSKEPASANLREPASPKEVGN